jgi:hypothetical protein
MCVIKLIISINDTCIRGQIKKIILLRERLALEPLKLFCKGKEHDAKGMQDSC